MIDPKFFSRLAEQLMSCPAAPYHEAGVRATVELICAEHGLDFERDAFGNVLVRVRHESKARPLVLAAHLDHPGFEMVRPITSERWRSRFLGGVPDEFFRPGLPLRVMPGGVPAVLGKRIQSNKEFEVHLNMSAASPLRDRHDHVDHGKGARPAFAVWELEDFAVRNGRIHGRSCDDLIGVATILATLIVLKRTRSPANVIGVISRAEEVGFQGALMVARSRHLPKNSLVISLETSRELPPVKMGKGVIIRVGDRASIFDSAGTRFLTEVAGDLRSNEKPFQFQRALMSGGTCEATAYQELGFQTAAVCVALGNYHNCGPRGRIAEEFVSLADACGMTDLLVEAARQMPAYGKLIARLPARLAALSKEARQKLR